MLIEPEGLRGLLLSAGLELERIENVKGSQGKTPVQAFAEVLTAYVQGLLPEGVPAYTLSALQARAVITQLAPAWAAHTVKFMALDFTMTAAPQTRLLVNIRAKKDTEDALKQIEYVLYALTALQPAPDVNVFMRLEPNGAPIYDPDAANAYMRTLAQAWETMPLRDEAPAKLS